MAAVAAMAVLTAPCAQAEGILAWIQQISTLNSAYRTVTKQVDAAAEKKNRIRMQAVQALGSAMLDLYNAEQVRKAVNDFGPQGQLVDPCYQLAMASTTHETSV
ncbi:MAG TPA: hypothetical protein VGD46_21135, partial [Rhizobacter sp.]